MGSQVASVLNTTGMYSITRNPLYLGNAVTYMAIALFTQSPVFVLTMGLFLVIYLERIIATEEQFLIGKFGPAYCDWAQRVPVLLPDFKRWQPAKLPFCFKTVLRREYPGFFAVVATFTIIDFAHEAFGEGNLSLGLAWSAFFVCGAVVYVVLRSLKKHTSVLSVAGR